LRYVFRVARCDAKVLLGACHCDFFVIVIESVIGGMVSTAQKPGRLEYSELFIIINTNLFKGSDCSILIYR
jgi:hypothetical protein